MPDPSSTKFAVPTLPQSGGAIRGLGEKFQASTFDGTGAFSVPIPVTSGRGSLSPQLTLGYSTGNGNGPFGLGWSLGVPAVTRKTDKGLPRYDSSDVFVLSGAEDLVPLEEGTPLGATRRTEGDYLIFAYRPRTESLYARIERWQSKSTARSHWRVVTRDNITSLFGLSDAARISDPADSSRVFQWLLEESFDAKGNHLYQEYAQDESTPVALSVQDKNRSYAQRYLRRIFYTPLPASLVDTSGAPLKHPDGSIIGVERLASDPQNPTRRVARRYAFEVVFDYGDWDAPLDASAETVAVGFYRAPTPDGSAETFCSASSSPPGLITAPRRPDAFSHYRAGFEVRTLRRCRRILVYHHLAETGPAALVKATLLNYRSTEQSGISLLSSLVVAGYRSSRPSGSQLVQRCLPPLQFSYTRFDLEERRLVPLQARDGAMPPVGLQHPEYALVDLFGNGLPDLLHAGDQGFRYWRNLGDGCFDTPRLLPDTPAGLSLAREGVSFEDTDGDGRLELVVRSGPLTGYFEASNTGGWADFHATQLSVSPASLDKRARRLDLTGDGLPDLLITSDHHFEWFRNCGGDEFRPEPAVERIRDEDTFPDVMFDERSGRIRLADMTGDGLQDIVRIHHGQVEYWPNLGYGRFGSRVIMGTLPDAPEFDSQFEADRLFFVSVDGTGCADLVYVGATEVHLWFNQSGNTWSPRRVIKGTPYAPTGAGLVFADVFGTGTATLIWSRSQGEFPGAHYFALDFSGGRKAHLLAVMNNGLGACTCVEYATSTRFALEDDLAGRPWFTQLPFPVQVVERVETFDAVSRSRQIRCFRYRHGFYDGQEREFRGFGCVEQYDTEAFGTPLSATDSAANEDEAVKLPPVLTKTWYHTGAWFSEGSLAEQFRQEFWAGDPAAFLLPTHALPNEAEAFRALRGLTLRTELYALDAEPLNARGAKAGLPFSVAENRYQVTVLQAGTAKAHAVLQSTLTETLSFNYERNASDPRVTHRILFSPDSFGCVSDSVAIAYPRRVHVPDLPEQTVAQLVYTKSDFIHHPVPANAWLIGVPAQERLFEVTGVAPSGTRGFYRPSDFSPIIADLAVPFSTGTCLPFEAIPPTGTPSKRLFEWTRHYFRRDRAAADIAPGSSLANRLPLGEIESLSLLHETLKAVFTKGLLQHVYAGRVNTAELQLAGYIQEPDVTDHWWSASGQSSYDPALFYQPTGYRDAFGQGSVAVYDRYALLVAQTRDALGNQTSVRNDYRVLQPCSLVNPNGHVTELAYDSLGRVVGTALHSTQGEGDTLAGFEADPSVSSLRALLANPRAEAAAHLKGASSCLLYDLGSIPPCHVTLARTEHNSVNASAPIHLAFAYSDGFGREVQKRVSAEPDAAGVQQWAVSGWTVFNNKAKPVRQFEPFFSGTHGFEFDTRAGVSPWVFYDPLGRVIATLKPDHSWEKIEFGAWQEVRHDVQDTVSITDPRGDPTVGLHFSRLPKQEWFPTWHAAATASGDAALQEAARKAALHANTPATIHLDVLGRPVLALDNLGHKSLKTRSRLDIKGNVREVWDRRGLCALVQQYDLTGRQLSALSVDSGLTLVLPDLANASLYSWDAKGNRVFCKYDAGRRPIERWLQQGTGASHTLTEKTIYGESATLSEQQAGNLRGQVWKVFDGAGFELRLGFDFKGNLLGSSRTLCADPETVPSWGQAADPLTHRFDEAAAIRQLDQAHAYSSRAVFDALNRVVSMIMPEGSAQHFRFNEANLLNSVLFQHRAATVPELIVREIKYDARGQRRRVVHGNGTVTEYEYNNQTFELSRLITKRGARTRRLLQDLAFTYDVSGNVTHLRDAAHEQVFFAGQAVAPASDYTYDALNRLIEGTGREHIAFGPCHLADGNSLQAHYIPLGPRGQPVSNAQALANYVQRYTYDDGDNLTELRHLRSGTTHWVRSQTFETASNQLRFSRAGCLGDGTLLSHDANGNVLRLGHLPSMEWDERNRLLRVQLNQAGAQSNRAFYHYDATGRRVRKIIRRGTLIEERISLSGFEVFVTRNASGPVERWETLHLADGEKRIALIETKTEAGDASRILERLTRYQFSNHLGSATLETDGSQEARIISYEEYTPYGECSYSGGGILSEVRRKRYRFSGKEHDDESGLSYFGARYLATWLGRWLSPDPAGIVDGTNLYGFVRNNPVGLRDTCGRNSTPSRPIVTETPLDIANPKQTGLQVEGYVKDFRTATVSYPGKGPTVQVITTFVPVGGGDSAWYATEVTLETSELLGTGSTREAVRTPLELGGNGLMERARTEQLSYLRDRAGIIPEAFSIELAHPASLDAMAKGGAKAFPTTPIGERTQATMRSFGLEIDIGSLKFNPSLGRVSGRFIQIPTPSGTGGGGAGTGGARGAASSSSKLLSHGSGLVIGGLGVLMVYTSMKTAELEAEETGSFEPIRKETTRQVGALAGGLAAGEVGAAVGLPTGPVGILAGFGLGLIGGIMGYHLADVDASPLLTHMEAADPSSPNYNPMSVLNKY